MSDSKPKSAADIVDTVLKDTERPKQADVLIGIAQRGVLFHNHEDVAFADIMHNGHRETWPVRSAGFRRWLLFCYFSENNSAPNNEAVATALHVIEADASYRGDEYPVAVRIGGHGGKIYLDLCNKDWQAIEIDGEGWRLVDESPIRFIRSRGMLPLPLPVRKKKTSVKTLKGFINVKDDADFCLVVAWIIGAFRDRGPYAVLAFIAQHGSAKSTSLKVLRALIDPHAAELRAPPKTADDLYITAARSHVIPIDNVSTLAEWLSDALCRIATGMSYAKRMLYTDQDEVLIYAVRPVALTSIVEVVTAPDLGDRTITIVPPRIEDRDRREEAQVLAAFEQERPAILAAFLDAVAHGLKTFPDLADEDWPRMADFAKWVTACEGAYDIKGTFLKAYRENRSNAINALLGEDMVASAIMQLPLPWQGQIGKLLAPLTEIAGDQAKSKEWPKTARGLGGILRRLAPFLREAGIAVEPPAKNDKTRVWLIRAVAPGQPQPPGQQPDQQPDDKPLKEQAETQASSGTGGLGCCFPYSAGEAPDSDNEAHDSQPAEYGNIPPEQPEQPETAFSVNDSNELDSGCMSGDSLGDTDQPPEQPAHDELRLREQAKDDLTTPPSLGRRGGACAQCGQPGGIEWNYEGVRVRLHEHCEQAWIERYEAQQ